MVTQTTSMSREWCKVKRPNNNGSDFIVLPRAHLKKTKEKPYQGRICTTKITWWGYGNKLWKKGGPFSKFGFSSSSSSSSSFLPAAAAAIRVGFWGTIDPNGVQESVFRRLAFPLFMARLHVAVTRPILSAQVINQIPDFCDSGEMERVFL